MRPASCFCVAPRSVLVDAQFRAGRTPPYWQEHGSHALMNRVWARQPGLQNGANVSCRDWLRCQLAVITNLRHLRDFRISAIFDFFDSIGQNQKNSKRAYVFRFAPPKADIMLRTRHVLFMPIATSRAHSSGRFSEKTCVHAQRSK